MPRAVARRFTLADVMLLVATTGFSLSCYLSLDNALFKGQRYLYGLFERPAGGWDSSQMLDRASGAFALLLTLFGGWTLILPFLRLRGPRPGWRGLRRQPGVLACIAATTGMTTCAGVAVGMFVLRWGVDGLTRLPPGFWVHSPLLDDLVVYPCISVAAVWVAQVATGGWRPTSDWVDRLGRFLGGLWIAAGLVFAVRLLLQ